MPSAQVYFLQMAIVFVGHGSVLDWAHFINFRVAQAIGVSRCLFLVTPVGRTRACYARTYELCAARAQTESVALDVAMPLICPLILIGVAVAHKLATLLAAALCPQPEEGEATTTEREISRSYTHSQGGVRRQETSERVRVAACVRAHNLPPCCPAQRAAAQQARVWAEVQPGLVLPHHDRPLHHRLQRHRAHCL